MRVINCIYNRKLNTEYTGSNHQTWSNYYSLNGPVLQLSIIDNWPLPPVSTTNTFTALLPCPKFLIHVAVLLKNSANNLDDSSQFKP